MVCSTQIFQNLALYLDFEEAKTIYVLKVLIRGYGGSWRLLPVNWYLNFDLYSVTGVWYIYVWNFGSLS